jgi:hypothetical protein
MEKGAEWVEKGKTISKRDDDPGEERKKSAVCLAFIPQIRFDRSSTAAIARYCSRKVLILQMFCRFESDCRVGAERENKAPFRRKNAVGDQVTHHVLGRGKVSFDGWAGR